MPDLPPDDKPLAAVGRYPRFSQAQERGLVAAAMDLPYWVIREGNEFVLYVEESASAVVSPELAKFEEESAARPAIDSRQRDAHRGAQSFARACWPCQPFGIDASSRCVYGIFGCR